MNKVYFLGNSWGVNWIVDEFGKGDKEMEGLFKGDGVRVFEKEGEWEEFEVESKIVKRYECNDDGLVRIEVEDDFKRDEIVGEVDRLDDVLFG